MNRIVRTIILAAFMAFAICLVRAQDTTPPTIVKSSPDATSVAVIVEFSEAVTDTALDTANYALTNSALNRRVHPQRRRRTVVRTERVPNQDVVLAA